MSSSFIFSTIISAPNSTSAKIKSYLGYGNNILFANNMLSNKVC